MFVVRKAVEKVKRKIESNIEKTMQIWFHVAILDLNYKLFMASPQFLESDIRSRIISHF